MNRWGDERSECGQAAVLLIGLMLAVCTAVLAWAALGSGRVVEGDAQRAADLAALAGARAMHASYPRLFTPAVIAGRPNPAYLSRARYLDLARSAAERTARANAASATKVAFPVSDSLAPLQIRVEVSESVGVKIGDARDEARVIATGTAELLPAGGGGAPTVATGGGYSGPLATRQGKSMRPDVALAFDRMERAARADGIGLIITSGYRSDAEQAVLWARNPDPRWVAPPGKSLHRLGTELDLGPRFAYDWLAAHATQFGFIQRYSWEPWHFGYVLNARSRPGAAAVTGAADGERDRELAGGGSMPAFVPERFAPAISRAAQRWNVSATLLAAQLYRESTFDPFAISKAGAQGIAQFMPATAAGYGLRNPFEPDEAIDAQAHLMHDLLQQFASVPLALAAYNAGPAPVEACGCIPNNGETPAYVAMILGLMGGAGEGLAAPGGGLVVRLVS